MVFTLITCTLICSHAAMLVLGGTLFFRFGTALYHDEVPRFLR